MAVDVRVPWTLAISFGVTIGVFVSSICLLFIDEHQPGWAVIAILLSAFTWWLASLFAELDWLPVRATVNHLNALAASTAAVAGVLTINQGWQKVIALF